MSILKKKKEEVDLNKIGLQIENEEVAFWTRVKKAADDEVKTSKQSIKLNELISGLAQIKITESK